MASALLLDPTGTTLGCRHCWFRTRGGRNRHHAGEVRASASCWWRSARRPASSLASLCRPRRWVWSDTSWEILKVPNSNFLVFSELPGNILLWGTEPTEIADFFFAPAGHGLCVDRLALDEALRTKAVAAGATLLKDVCFQSCTRIEGCNFNWQLTLTSRNGTRHDRARYLVDCSGRQAVVARILGVPTVSHSDRLFAYAQWFSCSGGDDDRYTRMRPRHTAGGTAIACPASKTMKPDGWWFCTPIRICRRRGWRRRGKAWINCWTVRRILRLCSKPENITLAGSSGERRPIASDYETFAATPGWRWVMRHKPMIRCRRKASTRRSGRRAMPGT